MANRQRSPRYPSLNLGEAIERAKAYYGRFGKALTSPEEAVSAWGYKGINGASARTLASVRQYGLLEDVGSDVRISALALTILLEDEESPDHADAVRSASREPKVFAEILDEFPEGLPSDRSLIAHLVRKRGFSEDAAKTVNDVLRATTALVSGGGASGQSGGSSAPPATQEDIEDRGGRVPPPPQPHHPAEGEDSHVRRPLQRPEGRIMQFQHELADGGSASLILAGDRITMEDVDDLYDWLEIVKRTIQRRVKRAVTEGDAPVVPAES